MDQLKEIAIVETFRGLSEEQQKSLLQKLIAEAKLTCMMMKFKSDEDRRLYNFAREQWLVMSLDFFERVRNRWQFLCQRSYGNNVISCADIGDLYLQAEAFPNNGYRDFPFKDANRMKFFYHEVFKECKWEYMYISVILNGNFCINYLIKNLMELSDENYVAKMIEYKFM